MQIVVTNKSCDCKAGSTYLLKTKTCTKYWTSSFSQTGDESTTV